MQEKAQESTDQGLVFGGRCYESSAWYDRDTRSWKTRQVYLLGGLAEYSEAWPRSGTMQNGKLYPRDSSARFMFGEGRLLLPTLVASEHKGTAANRYRGSTDFRGSRMSEGLRTCSTDPQYLTPLFAEWVMGFGIQWTVLERSAMPSSHKSQSSSREK